MGSEHVASGALSFMIAARHTALLVIDVQHDFVAAEGFVGRSGVDVSVLTPALAQLQRLIAAARRMDVTRVFPRVITRPETDSSAMKLLMQRRGAPADALALCRAGTPGADYYQVAPLPGEIEVEKTLYSSFSGTRLAERLREHNIDNLVVAGFTTECCVDSTVRDAFEHGFNVFVVTDACASYELAMHQHALEALACNCALLTNTADVLAAWTV